VATTVTSSTIPPTVAPTQAPNVQQHITNAIPADSDTVSYCFIVSNEITVVARGQTVVITADESHETDVFDNDRAKKCIFYLEKDAWASDPTLAQVTVNLQVLLQDKYGKQFVGDLAWALLKQETERKFVWENLDPVGAWALYDNTYLLPS